MSVSCKHWTLEDAELLPKPTQAGGPPIWMGGSGDTALRWAGQRFDGWFPNSPTPETFRTGWTRVQAATREAKRPLSGVTPAFAVTEAHHTNARAAETELRQFIQGYYMVPYETIAARQGCYAGPPEGCVEWLRKFAEVGVRHVVLRFAGPGQLPQLDRAAAVLLPRLGGESA